LKCMIDESVDSFLYICVLIRGISLELVLLLRH